MRAQHTTFNKAIKQKMILKDKNLLKVVCWALIFIFKFIYLLFILALRLSVIIIVFELRFLSLIGLEKERTTDERRYRLWNYIIQMQNMSQVISKGKRCYIPRKELPRVYVYRM